VPVPRPVRRLGTRSARGPPGTSRGPVHGQLADHHPRLIRVLRRGRCGVTATVEASVSIGLPFPGSVDCARDVRSSPTIRPGWDHTCGIWRSAVGYSETSPLRRPTRSGRSREAPAFSRPSAASLPCYGRSAHRSIRPARAVLPGPAGRVKPSPAAGRDGRRCMPSPSSNTPPGPPRARGAQGMTRPGATRMTGRAPSLRSMPVMTLPDLPACLADAPARSGPRRPERDPAGLTTARPGPGKHAGALADVRGGYGRMPPVRSRMPAGVRAMPATVPGHTLPSRATRPGRRSPDRCADVPAFRCVPEPGVQVVCRRTGDRPSPGPAPSAPAFRRPSGIP
jgi:hypothetical protein